MSIGFLHTLHLPPSITKESRGMFSYQVIVWLQCSQCERPTFQLSPLSVRYTTTFKKLPIAAPRKNNNTQTNNIVSIVVAYSSGGGESNKKTPHLAFWSSRPDHKVRGSNYGKQISSLPSSQIILSAVCPTSPGKPASHRSIACVLNACDCGSKHT